MTSQIDFMQQPAIDMHGHCGHYGGYSELVSRLVNAPPEVVSRRAAEAAIKLTVVSELSAFDPAADQPADVDAANGLVVRAAEEFGNLCFYAVANPKRENWEAKTDALLSHPKCVGVKLHPRWNYWPVKEYGDRVFAFLNERETLTLSHTGNAGNEPEQFIPFANRYPRVRLILAHIGHDEIDETRDRQIRAVQMATQGNVWTDTSSSKSVTSGLIEYAVEQIGASRILFGTDTPLYCCAMQKARIAYAGISNEDKRKILYGNAAQLLGLSAETSDLS